MLCMRIYVIAGVLAAVLFVYFFMTLVILPEEYRSHKIVEPQPIHLASVSENEIPLGDSFKIEIEMKNQNDFADIVLTSVGFPNLDDLDSVEVIGYDYTQSPKEIDIGYEVGSDYTYGDVIPAVYPSIEADSRNIPADSEFRMVILVTPPESGPFEVYVKTVAIPHTTEYSHYPYEGLVDPQGEFVDVFAVNVSP